MNPQLSPYRLGKARDVYNIYNVFNALSWNMLVGSIITLFAMRLGASSTYIGLLSAMIYVSFFFLPLGKILARRFSIIGIFSFAWTWRAICMVMAVAAPLAEHSGRRDLALLFTIIGVFAFHFFRGIGMVGNNPVLSELAAGPDRGSYLTQIQIVNSAVTMFSSFLVAMALGREPPIYLYSILLGAGVICGIVSGRLIKKVPEPPGEDGGGKIKLLSVFREALSQDGLRLFMVILFLVAMVSGVSRAFVVVYAREVFGHNDGMVSLYAVFGGLGYLMIGLFIKFLVDRIGAKPIFIVCVIIGLASMIPIVFLPLSAVDNMTGAILFLSFLFFMLNFGFLGSEGIAQTYFMGLIPAEKMLDLGILYFLIFGAAGAGGSFLAGILLDLLSGMGISAFVAFKILFALQIVLAVIALILQKKLTSLGSLSLKGALQGHQPAGQAQPDPGFPAGGTAARRVTRHSFPAGDQGTAGAGAFAPAGNTPGINQGAGNPQDPERRRGKGAYQRHYYQSLYHGLYFRPHTGKPPLFFRHSAAAGAGRFHRLHARR